MVQLPNLKKKEKFVLDQQILVSPNLSKIKKQLNPLEAEFIDDKSKLNQKLTLHSLQKHLSILKLEEYLLIVSFITAGILGRFLLQGLPSVEPITFFALLAGALFGWKKGAFTGATTWYLSNFFMFGGQGPWSLIHLANGAIAGFLGGIFLMNLQSKYSHYIKAAAVMLAATLIFELSINIMSGLIFFGLLASFLTAIPFAITHIISNTFLSLLLPKASKEINEKGKLNEKELYQNIIKKIKSLKSKNES